MRKTTFLYGLILLLLPAAAMGDIIVMKNGSRFEGEVTETEDCLEVDIGYGKVTIPKLLVEKVIKCDTPRQQFQKKLLSTDQKDLKQLKTLREWCVKNYLKKEAKEIALKIGRLALEKNSGSLDTGSSGAVFDFALWCKRNGYDTSVVGSYLWKVVSLDPDHKAAREMLGQRNFRGQWLSKKEIEDIREAEYEKKMQEKGMVKYNGRWLMPQDCACLKQLEDLDKRREELERDRIQIEDDRRELSQERAEIQNEKTSLRIERNKLRHRENTLERTAFRQSALAEQLAYDRVYIARLKIELEDLKKDLRHEKEELTEERDNLEKEKTRLAQLKYRLDCEWRRLRQARREKKDCRPETERPEKADKKHKGSEEHTPGRQPYNKNNQQTTRRERVRR